MSTGLPSFTPATTMAPGASIRLRTTSHILRIWPPSRTSVRAMMTGYPAGASCTWESSVANMSSPIMLLARLALVRISFRAFWSAATRSDTSKGGTRKVAAASFSSASTLFT